MFDRLIEHVEELPAEQVGELSLEDVALCATWLECCRNTPEVRESGRAIAAQMEQWTRDARPRPLETEARRHQPLLRALVSELLKGNFSELKQDEAVFLRTAFDQVQRVVALPSFERIHGLLARYAKDLHLLFEKSAAAFGLPALGARLDIVAASDIQRAKSREVKMLAGLDLPFRGPVFTHSGNLKVLGGVPEGSLLSVKDGSCTVVGYVLGTVAVTAHCEITDNISGVVIAHQGDIRTRNVVDNALIVAKWGQVRCRNGHGPRLVFAGTAIHVTGNAIGGCYVAPRVEVVNEAYGGSFHGSELVTAGRFRQSDTRPLTIVLRRGLSCRDYGEVPSREAATLLGKAARLDKHLRWLTEMAEIVEREAEQHAATALLFLYGGEKVARRLEELQRDQRRLAFLDRIISGVDGMKRVAEERLDQAALAAVSSSGVEKRADSEEISPSEELSLALASLESEGSVDADLELERTELLAAGQKLAGKNPDVHVASDLLERFRQRLAGWTRESAELSRSIEQKQNEFQDLLRRQEIVEGVTARSSKLQVFRQFMSAIKRMPPNDEVRERAQSSFVRVLARLIDMRTQYAAKYRQEAFEVRQTLQEITRDLRKDYQITALGAEGGLVAQPKACGRFDAGIKVCADSFRVQAPAPPEGTVIKTRESGDQIATYVRTPQGRVVTA